MENIIVEAAHIDWLDYTVHLSDDKALWSTSGEIPWEKSEGKARYGFTQIEVWQGCERWSDPAKAYVHYSLSGKACADLSNAARQGLSTFDWQKHFAWLLSKNVSFTRIDIAINDTSNRITVQQIADACSEGRFVSQWQQSSMREMRGLSPKGNVGHTVYCGSNKSASMLRVYDKWAEMRLPEGLGTWVRVEMQCRKETADAMARKIAEKGMQGAVAVINRYFRPLWHDGTTLNGWQRLLGETVKEKLHVLKRGGTEGATRRWLRTDVAGSLAAIVQIDGRGLLPLLELIEQGEKQMSPRHRTMVARAKAERDANVSHETFDTGVIMPLEASNEKEQV